MCSKIQKQQKASLDIQLVPDPCSMQSLALHSMSRGTAGIERGLHLAAPVVIPENHLKRQQSPSLPLSASDLPSSAQADPLMLITGWLMEHCVKTKQKQLSDYAFHVWFSGPGTS